MAQGHTAARALGNAAVAVVAVVVAATVVGTGIAAPRVAATELSKGEVAVAFGPEFTGDPTKDFARAVGAGDTVTIYVIAGPLPAPSRRFSFGLGISEAQNLAISEVRSFGFARVDASQNPNRTIVRVAVVIDPACFDLGAQGVIAEVDLVRVGREIPVQVQLGNYLYASSLPPELETCQSLGLFFDDSTAERLSVQVPAPVPVSRSRWTTIKSLYRSP